MGAFKFRGAYNAVARLSATERARGVLTYSSGNHAQAIALACRLLGAQATIVMPENAPRAKRCATEGYGARIVAYDPAREKREEVAERLRRDGDPVLIPPYDHADVIAGQGTAARELFEEAGALDLPARPVRGRRAALGLGARRSRARAVLPRRRRRARAGRRCHALLPHRHAPDREQPAHDRRRRAHAVARLADLSRWSGRTSTTWRPSRTTTSCARCASPSSASSSWSSRQACWGSRPRSAGASARAASGVGVILSGGNVDLSYALELFAKLAGD
jgi:hypothetical protein